MIQKEVHALWAATEASFSRVPYPNLNPSTEAARRRWSAQLDVALRHERDLDFTLFGFKTLMQSYLIRDAQGEVVERPQHLWLRVALGIHDDDLDDALECYDLLSRGMATHATPTLFNAGTVIPQMSSCFLLALKEDSIDGIFRTVHDCANISKSAGGIGVHIHNVRASGAHIHGTNGTSNGIVPMLRVFNNTARYVDQGGGKRKGSFAIWLEPWHLDVLDFLQLRKNTGAEEDRARDLFLGLWVNDLFMQRVMDDADWTLFCPKDVGYLADLTGEEFATQYKSLEASDHKVRRKTIKARTLWTEILSSQVETGTPYIMFKDTCNAKSNQQNLGTIKASTVSPVPTAHFAVAQLLPVVTCEHGLHSCLLALLSPHVDDGCVCVVHVALDRFLRYPGTVLLKFKDDAVKHILSLHLIVLNLHANDRGFPICFFCFSFQSSNLCCEIVEYSDKEETAVCNLASVALPAHVVDGQFDYGELMQTVRTLVRNLNKIIDKNHYPTPECRQSNLRHRPIAIGVQGFADLLAMLELAFDDAKTKQLNELVFAHIYYAAVDASCKLAEHYGPYESYHGSPASRGQLQPDLWGVTPVQSPLLDWDWLRHRVASFGLRNSLLTAVMPTASTAQILGNTEAIDPVQSNLYSRRTLAGNFLLRNEHLVKKLGSQWNDEMEAYLLAHRGSIADHPTIDPRTKEIFKTIWEIKQKTLVDLAAGRGPYIDQAQSRSLYFGEVTDQKLSAAIFYAWKCGLKTGMYYCRTLPKAHATAFTAECTACSA